MDTAENYICAEICEKEGAMDDLIEEKVLDDLIAGLAGRPEEERKKFVHANVPQMCSLLTWLSHTIAKNEKDSSGTRPSNKKKLKLVEATSEQVVLAKDREELEEEGQSATDKVLNGLVDFALEQLSFLSYACGEGGITEEAFSATMLTNDHILFHLNRRVYMGTATPGHMCVLINFTRQKAIVEKLAADILPRFPRFLGSLLKTIVKPGTSAHNSRHLAMSYLVNLTQSRDIRRQLVEGNFLHPLMDIYEHRGPKTTTLEDEQLRTSCLNIVRNVTLDEQEHKNLISEDNTELLVRLVLPLAGPEALPETEMEQLPLALQYLEAEKRREANVERRRLLLESLLQLCSTRHGRLLIRDSNIYFLLREYFNWELVPELVVIAENLIDIVIKKEEEIALDGQEPIDNLKEVHIPADMVAKLDKLKLDELEAASGSSIKEVK